MSECLFLHASTNRQYLLANDQLDCLFIAAGIYIYIYIYILIYTGLGKHRTVSIASVDGGSHRLASVITMAFKLVVDNRAVVCREDPGTRPVLLLCAMQMGDFLLTGQK